VGPGGDGSDEQKDHDDEKDEAKAHGGLLTMKPRISGRGRAVGLLSGDAELAGVGAQRETLVG